MFIEQIVTAGHIYHVVDDVTTTYQALIIGRARDEITKEPLAVALDVHTNLTGVLVKTAAAGYYCVAGRAHLLFPDQTVAHEVVVSLAAARYRTVTHNVVIPAAPTFPVYAADVLLRPQPVRLQGRVMEDGSKRTPVAGARVEVIDPSSPLPAEHVVALRTSLGFDHDTVGVTVRGRPFNGTGAVRALHHAAPGGATQVMLTDRTGLAGNPILRFGLADGPIVEYSVVDAVSNDPPNLAQPGQITLRTPLTHTHPAGTPVEPVTPGAITTTAQLARPAQAGDGLLILDTAVTEPTIEIDDPSAPREIHQLGAVTDATGFYRLDGIGRLSKIRLHVTAAGYQARTLDWVVNYGQSHSTIDFFLKT